MNSNSRRRRRLVARDFRVARISAPAGRARHITSNNAADSHALLALLAAQTINSLRVAYCAAVAAASSHLANRVGRRRRRLARKPKFARRARRPERVAHTEQSAREGHYRRFAWLRASPRLPRPRLPIRCACRRHSSFLTRTKLASDSIEPAPNLDCAAAAAARSASAASGAKTRNMHTMDTFNWRSACCCADKRHLTRAAHCVCVFWFRGRSSGAAAAADHTRAADPPDGGVARGVSSSARASVAAPMFEEEDIRPATSGAGGKWPLTFRRRFGRRAASREQRAATSRTRADACPGWPADLSYRRCHLSLGGGGAAAK